MSTATTPQAGAGEIVFSPVKEGSGKPSKSLSVYSRISDPMDFVGKMGSTIYESKMFGCVNAAQGRMLALAFLTRGVDPFEFRARHHVIGGNVTLSAEAMLADFRTDLGGSHQIVTRTPEKAAVELTLGKKKNLFEFTWEEAQAEDYIYTSSANDKKTPKFVDGKVNPDALKDNWKTPRKRMQMLWARVVSDGVGAMAPEICGGRLTPEELDVLGNEVRAESSAPASAASSVDDSVIDGEFEVKPEASQVAASVANAAPAATAAPAASEAINSTMTTKLELPDLPPADVQRMNLLRELKPLKEELLTPEQYASVLDKKGVKSAKDLDLAELDKLVNGLRLRKAKKAEDAERAQWPESAAQGK